MRNIYSGASRVVLWLGLAIDDSGLAMEVIQRLYEFWERPALKDEHLLKSDEVKARLIKMMDTFDFGQSQALLKLCRRSYWRRVCIVQELHLARDYVAHCGRKSISGTVFDSSLAFISRLHGRFIERAYSGFMWRILHSAANEHMVAKRIDTNFHTLRRWLRTCHQRRFLSTVPRDYIYAILGISSDCQNGELQPDYEKPLLKVFLDAITICKREPITFEKFCKFAREVAEKLGLTVDEDVQRLISSIGGSCERAVNKADETQAHQIRPQFQETRRGSPLSSSHLRYNITRGEDDDKDEDEEQTRFEFEKGPLLPQDEGDFHRMEATRAHRSNRYISLAYFLPSVRQSYQDEEQSQEMGDEGGNGGDNDS